MIQLCTRFQNATAVYHIYQLEMHLPLTRALVKLEKQLYVWLREGSNILIQTKNFKISSAILSFKT